MTVHGRRAMAVDNELRLTDTAIGLDDDEWVSAPR